MSRETEVINGSTMIARISDAARMSLPFGGASNRKNFDRRGFSLIGVSTCFTSHGERTKIPQRPYTTLGIAASSSIRNETGVRIQRGANSARKIAAPTPIGTAMTRAQNEV